LDILDPDQILALLMAGEWICKATTEIRATFMDDWLIEFVVITVALAIAVAMTV
jgi:hypothetical protein